MLNKFDINKFYTEHKYQASENPSGIKTPTNVLQFKDEIHSATAIRTKTSGQKKKK